MSFTNLLDPKTEPILDAATKFLWSEDLQESVDQFTANYVGMFHGADGMDGEQRFEWTGAHKEFCELFEFRLEQFVESQGFTGEEFVSACQDALTNGADAWAAWNGADPARVRSKQMVEVVMAAATYESFVRMMSDAAFLAGPPGEEDGGGGGGECADEEAGGLE